MWGVAIFIISIVFSAVWGLWFEWLRHRPAMLEQSTQDLVSFKLVGQLFFVSAGLWLVVDSKANPL